ncbi:hypothetical protein CP10743SC13_0288 [Chlamydia psittaci 10_743_SC13]|nr:hypothetical protein CP10743SC13_0288 [Chlamydia psittaci 10_743_SC13]
MASSCFKFGSIDREKATLWHLCHSREITLAISVIRPSLMEAGCNVFHLV